MQILASVLFVFTFQHSAAQCIYINEVLINGPGACDGNCNPNTEEWVELYNACTAPVDLSCYMMTDGDFTVTFPTGTIIPSHGFLTIGSVNSGIPIDINIATCNCASGAGIGTFTNTNEQIILLTNSGQVVDAVYWGVGQFPVNINSSIVGTCNSVSANFQSATYQFSLLPSGGANGCTLARVCDGSPLWVERCGNAITGHASNGIVNLDASFTASQTSICSGDCISYTDNSTGGATSWQWIFQGASTSSSTSNEPINICYPTPGNYDVTLIISNSCGADTGISMGYIHVQTGVGGGIFIAGNPTFCEGGNTTLSVPSAFSTYQWYLNGQPISGATSSFYTTQTPGAYYVSVGSGTCLTVSNTVIVSAQNIIDAVISSTVDTLCPGDVAILHSVNIANAYQWLMNGTIVYGQTNASLAITGPGTYQLITTTPQGCSDTSMVYVIIDAGLAAPTTQSSTGAFSFCEGDSITLSVNNNYSNYQWMHYADSLFGENTSSITVTQGGAFSVSLSVNGCIVASTPVMITVNPLPEAHINSSTMIFCEGNTVLLQSINSNFFYQWFLNGNALPDTQAQISAGLAGSYQLLVTSAEGCTALSQAVNLMKSVIVNVQILYDTTAVFCVGNEITLSSSPVSYSTYQWLANNTSSSDLPTYQINSSGNYSLIVTNSDGCSTSSSVELQFHDCGSIYIPNAFSPNGDGINDVFRALGTDIGLFEMWIYNRYGELVFYSNDPRIGWNGTYHLTNAPIGVYVYYFKAKDLSGKEIFYNGSNKGNVILLR